MQRIDICRKWICVLYLSARKALSIALLSTSMRTVMSKRRNAMPPHDALVVYACQLFYRRIYLNILMRTQFASHRQSDHIIPFR